MILSYAITALTLLLTLLQFLPPSRIGWGAVKVVCVVLLALTAWATYQQDKEREFTITSLKSIATRIDWEKTSVYVDIYESAGEFDSDAVSAHVKILNPNLLNQPTQASALAAASKCVVDDSLGYGNLPEEEAKLLYESLDQLDGSALLGKGNRVLVEDLEYQRGSIQGTPDGSSQVILHSISEPEALTRFGALTDLADALILTKLHADSPKQLTIRGMMLSIQTASGRQPLFGPWPPMSQRGSSVPVGSTSRYVGFCIPRTFIGSGVGGA